MSGLSGHRHRRDHRRAARALFTPTDVSAALKSEPTDDFWSWLFGNGDHDEKTRTRTTTTAAAPTGPVQTLDPIITTSSSTSTSTSTSTTTSLTSTTTSTIALTTSSSSLKPSSSSHLATLTFTRTATNAAAAAPSSSSSVAPVGSTSTGAIVGGVGAGIAGVALICGLIAFFIRRMKRRQDTISFDPAAFRRSAVLMHDPPTHDDTVAAGFNSRPPRPPPSFVTDRPATFGTAYGTPGPIQASAAAAYAAAQISTNTRKPPQGISTNHYAEVSSSSPSFGISPFNTTPVAYKQSSPFSPIGSPSPTDAYSHEVTTPPVFNRTSSASILTRKPSGNTLSDAQFATYPTTISADSARRSVPLPSSEYIDLSRSSITPFQAAQFQVLNGRASEDTMRAAPIDVPPPLPQKDNVLDSNRASVVSQSEDSHAINVADFPAPPSPALTATSRYRITSTPPLLPELGLRNSGLGEPSPIVGGFPIGNDAKPMNKAFPITPSPLASSFGASDQPLASPMTAAKRPETVYNLEDAYGGI